MATETRADRPRRSVCSTSLLSAAVVCFALSACTTTIESRGYVPDEDLMSQILPGVDNQESVRRTLGYPTSTATFDGFTWYYVSRRTENYLFFDERLIDQSVVEIHFDADGVVLGVVRHAVDEAKEITVVSRKTPTGGRKLGFFEQIFGNMGRFGSRGTGYSDPFRGTGI